MSPICKWSMRQVYPSMLNLCQLIYGGQITNVLWWFEVILIPAYLFCPYFDFLLWWNYEWIGCFQFDPLSPIFFMFSLFHVPFILHFQHIIIMSDGKDKKTPNSTTAVPKAENSQRTTSNPLLRLPSFRQPRDLTLGSGSLGRGGPLALGGNKSRKNYTPNLNVQRNKVKE